MANKVIGQAKVFQTQEYERKDGSKGFRVVAFTDQGDPVVFYRPAEEMPQKDNTYNMILSFDNRFNAIVRYQKNDK